MNTRSHTESGALRDIAIERRRQTNVEGWTPEHDDEHTHGELALAGACYALTSGGEDPKPALWPWDDESWRPKDYRRNLVRAAALLAAEIERIDRREARRG